MFGGGGIRGSTRQIRVALYLGGLMFTVSEGRLNTSVFCLPLFVSLCPLSILEYVSFRDFLGIRWKNLLR